MRKPPILPPSLNRRANTILRRHEIEFQHQYGEGLFKKPKSSSTLSWDAYWNFQFFGAVQQLPACCGVLEFQHLYPPPPESRFPEKLTTEEWTTLFEYSIRKGLQHNNRRMALLTLTNLQQSIVPFVEAAGFKPVSEGFNPGTRHTVTLWALSI